MTRMSSASYKGPGLDGLVHSWECQCDLASAWFALGRKRRSSPEEPNQAVGLVSGCAVVMTR